MTVTRGPDVERDSRDRPRRDHGLDIVELPTQTIDDRRRFASSWGFAGILTAIDPGYAKDWRKLSTRAGESLGEVRQGDAIRNDLIHVGKPHEPRPMLRKEQRSKNALREE